MKKLKHIQGDENYQHDKIEFDIGNGIKEI